MKRANKSFYPPEKSDSSRKKGRKRKRRGVADQYIDVDPKPTENKVLGCLLETVFDIFLHGCLGVVLLLVTHTIGVFVMSMA